MATCRKVSLFLATGLFLGWAAVEACLQLPIGDPERYLSLENASGLPLPRLLLPDSIPNTPVEAPPISTWASRLLQYKVPPNFWVYHKSHDAVTLMSRIPQRASENGLKKKDDTRPRASPGPWHVPLKPPDALDEGQTDAVDETQTDVLPMTAKTVLKEVLGKLPDDAEVQNTDNHGHWLTCIRKWRGIRIWIDQIYATDYGKYAEFGMRGWHRGRFRACGPSLPLCSGKDAMNHVIALVVRHRNKTFPQSPFSEIEVTSCECVYLHVKTRGLLLFRRYEYVPAWRFELLCDDGRIGYRIFLNAFNKHVLEFHESKCG